MALSIAPNLPPTSRRSRRCWKTCPAQPLQSLDSSVLLPASARRAGTKTVWRLVFPAALWNRLNRPAFILSSQQSRGSYPCFHAVQILTPKWIASTNPRIENSALCATFLFFITRLQSGMTRSSGTIAATWRSQIPCRKNWSFINQGRGSSEIIKSYLV